MELRRHLGQLRQRPQETSIEWTGDETGWEDREFHQPIENINFSPSADQIALGEELAALPEEVPAPDSPTRPVDELRLRFLAAGFEAGWLNDLDKPVVFTPTTSRMPPQPPRAGTGRSWRASSSATSVSISCGR